MLLLSSVCGGAMIVSSGLFAFPSAVVPFVLLRWVMLLPILRRTALIHIWWAGPHAVLKNFRAIWKPGLGGTNDYVVQVV
jgi:hypothetical protein